MGASTSTTFRDGLREVSPWFTQIHIHNQTNTPVQFFLARTGDVPRPEDAVEHLVPANSHYALHSGYYHEPRATLLVRTGVTEAKLIRAANGARLVVSLEPHGISVKSPDDVVFEEYADFAAVGGVDTVPMRFRGESFGSADSSSGSGHGSLVMASDGSAREVSRTVPPASIGKGFSDGTATEQHDADVERVEHEGEVAAATADQEGSQV